MLVVVMDLCMDLVILEGVVEVEDLETHLEWVIKDTMVVMVEVLLGHIQVVAVVVLKHPVVQLVEVQHLDLVELVLHIRL
jgi:hypothetical protein